MTRVLIVDDSEDLLDSYQMLLETEGYEVVRAVDGAAGLRAVEAMHPDLVLLDMMMPDVDGLQFLRRLPLGCTHPTPPVLANSGVEAYREEALRRGASAFLRKPVEPDVLLDAVRAVAARAPVSAETIGRNSEYAVASRLRSAKVREAIVAALSPPALDAIKARLRALARWLQRYYGFGATLIQLLHGDQLRIEASRGAPPPFAEGIEYPRELSWCDDVLDANSTVVLYDPRHHPLSHFSDRPENGAGLRFYAGVPLTTWSGAVIGTLCLCDVEPHVIHAEDMRLLEALGLYVAHALEEIAGGEPTDGFVLDGEALFAADLLPLFVQVGVLRAARVGGVVALSLVQLAEGADADVAARAAYAACDGRGLAVVRHGGDELALIEVGHDGDARRMLADAVAACRHAVDVQNSGTALCRVAPGSYDDVTRSDSDIGARLVSLARAAHDTRPRPPGAESAVV